MIRLRGGVAEMTVKDAHGIVIKPLPAPSSAQLWMRAAVLKPAIGSALWYLEGQPGWVALYKAYEAVRKMPNGGISNGKIKHFTRTANQEPRHPPKGESDKNPMELPEARALITQWVSAAIEDILAKNP